MTDSRDHYLHDHDHGHGHNHDHAAELRAVSRRRLWWALGINLAFLVVEIVGGLATNSLALLADAGHMFTDVLALALAIFMARLAERPPTHDRTFGLLRAEVIGAFLNGGSLVLIVGIVFWEAVQRLASPPPVAGLGMLLIATAGLAANAASAWVLFDRRNENVNVQGAFLHMVADALGSVGAIAAGAIILATGWTPADPIISMVIGALILTSSIGLLKRTTAILLNAVPEGFDFHEIKEAMEGNSHVAEVHDLHLWSITSGVPILTAHVQLNAECADTQHWQECLREMQTMLRERFHIEHSTLQFEPEGYEKDGRAF